MVPSRPVRGLLGLSPALRPSPGERVSVLAAGDPSALRCRRLSALWVGERHDHGASKSRLGRVVLGPKLGLLLQLVVRPPPAQFSSSTPMARSYRDAILFTYARVALRPTPVDRRRHGSYAAAIRAAAPGIHSSWLQCRRQPHCTTASRRVSAKNDLAWPSASFGRQNGNTAAHHACPSPREQMTDSESRAWCSIPQGSRHQRGRSAAERNALVLGVGAQTHGTCT